MTSLTADIQAAPSRSRAEQIVRRALFVRERPPRSGRDAQRLFSVAMAISGVRCLLSYVVLPFVAPAIGAATGVEPYFGVPISIVAIVFDVRGMRRFWLADHRYRWEMTFIYLAVIGLVTSLLVTDLIRLAR